MIKLIDPAGFNFDQPIMSLIDVHSRGVDSSWLRKSAAVLTKEMSEIRPEKDRTFMHLIALGDREKYGLNRNGDGFPKKANTGHHDTFVKFANFYRHHKNKPDRGHKIYGIVKHSAYNDEMARVELIISIDNQAAPDTIEKIASGQDIPVSMACKVPWDECTICGNKASSTDKYCGHLKKYATQVLTDGRQVGMLNHTPCFFDISEVVRNADRIALTMRKVASASSPIFSADLAAQMNVTAPMSMYSQRYQRQRALLSKLANDERRLAVEIAQNPALRNIVNNLNEPLGITKGASDAELGGVLGSLSVAHVSLPFEDFLKLAMGPRFSDVESCVPSARAALPTVFSDAEKAPEEFLKGAENYEPLFDKPLSNGVKTMIRDASYRGSLHEGPMNGRMTTLSLMKKAGVVPYKKALAPDAAGRCLAREYGQYKLAFLENMDPFVTKLSLLQNQ